MNELAARVLCTLNESGATTESAVQTLRTVEAVLLEMQELEDNFRCNGTLLVMGMSYA